MNPFRSRMFSAGLALAALAGSLPVSLLAQAAPARRPRPPRPSRPRTRDLCRHGFLHTGPPRPPSRPAPRRSCASIRRAIDESGVTNTTELLQKITVSNANSVPISNNALGFTPGASTVSLRGLGPEATLVLINGRRVAAYPVGVGGSTAFVDLGSIPLAAVDSIEVLKDGASALYGRRCRRRRDQREVPPRPRGQRGLPQLRQHHEQGLARVRRLVCDRREHREAHAPRRPQPLPQGRHHGPRSRLLGGGAVPRARTRAPSTSSSRLLGRRRAQPARAGAHPRHRQL